MSPRYGTGDQLVILLDNQATMLEDEPHEMFANPDVREAAARLRDVLDQQLTMAARKTVPTQTVPDSQASVECQDAAQIDARFQAINTRFTTVDRRITGVATRIDEVEQHARSLAVQLDAQSAEEEEQ